MELEDEQLAGTEHDAIVRAEEVLDHFVGRKRFCNFVSSSHEANFDVYGREVEGIAAVGFHSDLVTRDGQADPLSL